MHQRAAVCGLLRFWNNTGDKGTTAVLGFDHAAALKFVQRFPNDGPGDTQPGGQLALEGIF